MISKNYDMYLMHNKYQKDLLINNYIFIYNRIIFQIITCNFIECWHVIWNLKLIFIVTSINKPNQINNKEKLLLIKMNSSSERFTKNMSTFFLIQKVLASILISKLDIFTYKSL